MHRSPLRFVFFVSLLLIVAAIVGYHGLQLMAEEAADSGSFLPAIFGVAGNDPQPSPSATPTLPPNTTATATRPPKATETATPTVIGTSTPTPTYTATPLATETPINIGSPTPGLTPMTPTSTPLPTPQTSQAIILANNSSYVDKLNKLHVVGEVKNNGATAIQHITVKAAFYAYSGLELDKGEAYGALTILPPGEKTCFDIMIPLPVGYSYYEFIEVTHLTDAPTPPNLAVMNVQTKYFPSTGAFNIAGKVKNEGDTLLIEPMAIGTVYNSNGIVLGCNKVPLKLNGGPTPDDLAGGESQSFDMQFADRDYADVANYRVQADAQYPEEE